LSLGKHRLVGEKKGKGFERAGTLRGRPAWGIGAHCKKILLGVGCGERWNWKKGSTGWGEIAKKRKTQEAMGLRKETKGEDVSRATCSEGTGLVRGVLVK